MWPNYAGNDFVETAFKFAQRKENSPLFSQALLWSCHDVVLKRTTTKCTRCITHYQTTQSRAKIWIRYWYYIICRLLTEESLNCRNWTGTLWVLACKRTAGDLLAGDLAWQCRSAGKSLVASHTRPCAWLAGHALPFACTLDACSPPLRIDRSLHGASSTEGDLSRCTQTRASGKRCATHPPRRQTQWCCVNFLPGGAVFLLDRSSFRTHWPIGQSMTCKKDDPHCRPLPVVLRTCCNYNS